MLPLRVNPAGIYLLKVNNKDTRTTPENLVYVLNEWFISYFRQ